MVIFTLMKTFHTSHTLSHSIPILSSAEDLVVTPVQRRKLRLSGPIPSSRTLGTGGWDSASPFSLQISRDVFLQTQQASHHQQQMCNEFLSKLRLFILLEVPSAQHFWTSYFVLLSLNKHSKASANIWKHLLCARKVPKASHILCHSLLLPVWR